jgi:hypothetical protein
MTPLTEAEARRAVYVDFESLGNALAAPAILGSLVVDRRDDFRQFILIDLLRPAAVARKGMCISTSAEAAVLAVVEEAEHHSRAIVSWSTHEAKVVRAVCSTSLADRFDALHRNAIDTAKPWKRALYRTFRFRLKQLGGKHPLKEYLRMIAYPLPANIRPAAPAKWLKHTIQQMKANEARYKHVTPEAKRDWHKLLLYNEHDCRGMRAVMTLAAHELELWSAYQKTHFVVLDDGREITIRAGYRNRALDELLAPVGTTRWAFLTGHNPESKRLNARDNARRQQELREQLVAAGYHTLPGEGRDPAGEWPSEASVLVIGIGTREARAFGRRFGQLAILAGQAGFAARLVASGLAPDRGRSANTR